MKNFSNSKFYDTVYVTANPYVDRLLKNSFYRIISVWKDGWNDKANTVMPETMVKYALLVEEKYPDKRLIIHFMQPHIPFIKNPELTDPNFYKMIKDIGEGSKVSTVTTPWIEAAKGNIEISKVWKAYERNLEVVIPHAFMLAKKLKGKSIITADHGEAFRHLWFPIPIRIVGHPSQIYIPELTKVPWMIFNSKGRKEIREEATQDATHEEGKKTKERLRALGYL